MATSRNRNPRWRTPTGLIPVIVALSAIAATLSDAAPTGNSVGDIFWTAVTGATLARATVDARRWSWFPMAGAAATLANGAFALLCGVGSLVGVFAAGFFTARRRWIGALVGGLAAQALLRGHTYGFTGLPTIVAFAACAPVLVSAYLNASAKTKRVARISSVVGTVIMIVLTIFTVVSAVLARDRIREAIDFGNDAVDAAEAGDEIAAAANIQASAQELRSIATGFDRPWLYPARFVPLLGPHATVLHDVADAGADVAENATDVLVALDPDAIVIEGGSIDVQAVQELVAPMDRLRESLESGLDDVDDLDTTWVANAAEERVQEIVDELESRFDDVAVADDLLGITPQLLGSGEERRYLVMFMTASEARAAGGFAGNWAELVVDNGRLELVEAGRGDDISDALPPGGIIIPENLRGLYSGFELETTFQNLPVVPDFPTVAVLARAQYEAAFAKPVDGVIAVDHAGMAGIVALTGPIDVDGEAMDAQQVESFILRDQYTRYGDDNPRRLDVLDALTFDAFDQLVSADLPPPTRIVDVFQPLVEGNHVRVATLDNDENIVLERVGLADPFPVAGGQDLLAVMAQNLGENKIDIFLERELDYEVLIDPDSGAIASTLTVTLANGAPAEGLPQAIIGNNDQNLPFGTNRVRLQIYSPLEIVGASLDGLETELIREVELGWNRYRTDLWLDAGQTEVLQVQFSGVLDLSNGYVLDIEHQPMANDDTVSLSVQIRGSEGISSSSGLGSDGRAMVNLVSDQVVGVVLNQ